MSLRLEVVLLAIREAINTGVKSTLQPTLANFANKVLPVPVFVQSLHHLSNNGILTSEADSSELVSVVLVAVSKPVFPLLHWSSIAEVSVARSAGYMVRMP